MIFVTVGTQEPFERLIDAMDSIAEDLIEPVFAQTLVHEGPWQNIQSVHTLDATEFNARCGQARCIVGHVGIGTYLAARDHGKPLVGLPRRARSGEHRSDHQLHTADALRSRHGVQIVDDAGELRQALLSAREPAVAEPESYQNLLSELAGIVG